MVRCAHLVAIVVGVSLCTVRSAVAITFVQSTGKFRTGSGGSIQSAAFDPAPAVGHRIIVYAWTWAGGSPTPTITASDSQGNTYTVDAQASASSPRMAAAILSATVAATGAEFTVTVSSANSSSAVVAVALEYAGIGKLDRTAATTGTAASPTVSTATSTAGGGELVAAAVNIPFPSTTYSSLVPAAGYTTRVVELDNSAYEVGEGSDHIVTSAGVQSNTWTCSPTATSWAAAIATYLPRRVTVVGSRPGRPRHQQPAKTRTGRTAVRQAHIPPGPERLTSAR